MRFSHFFSVLGTAFFLGAVQSATASAQIPGPKDPRAIGLAALFGGLENALIHIPEASQASGVPMQPLPGTMAQPQAPANPLPVFQFPTTQIIGAQHK